MSTVAGHPLLAVVAFFAVVVTIVVALYLRLTADPPGTRNASRPAPGSRAGKMTRAVRRNLAALRRLPGNITWFWSTPVRPRGWRPGGPVPLPRVRVPVLHHEPGLGAEDTATITWLRGMRALTHPGQTAFALRARLLILGVITTLPIRGDAQGRDVQPRATDCCQAAGAMTGALSPRTQQEGAPVASAPPPGPTLYADSICADYRPGPEYLPAAVLAGSPGGARLSPTRLIPSADRHTVTAQVLAAVDQRTAQLAEIHAMPLDDYVAGLPGYEHDTAWFRAIDAHVTAGGCLMRYEFRPLGPWTGPETSPRRSSGQFKAKWTDTLAFLADELRHLEAAEPIVIQVDVDEADVRRDGMLRAHIQPRHPGVAISFESKFGPLRYATDAYDCMWTGAMPGWQANVRAIYLALVALRAVDRYGVTRRGEQYTGWRAIAAPAPLFPDAAAAEKWMRAYAAELLGPDGARQWNGSLGPLYRAMAKRMHPDHSDNRADWDRLDEARRVLAEAGRL